MYDLPEKKLVCHSEFASGGSALLWAPTTIDDQAVTIIAGFADGVVRCVGGVTTLANVCGKLPSHGSIKPYIYSRRQN